MKKSTVLFPLYNSTFKQPNVIQPKAIYRFIYSDEKRLVLVEGGVLNLDWGGGVGGK